MATNQEVLDNFINQVPDLLLGDPQDVGAATVIPILEDPEVERDYITFEEAINAKVLKFIDTGNINLVKIQNIGDKDILILAGQIVSSQGSQDRVFAESKFIAPNEIIEITANCCEASHPIYKNTQFAASFSSPRSIKYTSIMTDAPHNTRQSKIWNKVNKYREIHTKKGVYRSPKMTDKLEEIVEETKKNTKEVLGKAKLVDNQRGVIVLNNKSKLVGVELFDSPETYKNLHEKIVESYLEDITDKPKDKPKPGTLKNIVQNELKSLFAQKLMVDEKERTLFNDDKQALNGELLFRKGKKAKNRIVALRVGSETQNE